MRKHVGSLGATLAALLPGFALPFVASVILSPEDSDLFLLVYGAAGTMIAIVGPTIELNTISEFGRRFAAGASVDRSSLTAYTRSCVLFGLAGTAIAGAVLCTVYSLRAGAGFTLAPLFALACGIPIANAAGSVATGQLIASGRSAIAISLQFFRASFPLAILLFVALTGDATGPQLIATLVVAALVGELVRWLAASKLAKHHVYPSTTRVEHEVPPTNGLRWQATSAAISQGGPVTDRAVLAGTVGGVSAYESADKIYFAAVQLINYGLLVRMVAGWAQLPTMPFNAAKRRLARDIALLMGGAIAFIVVVGLAWFALHNARIPTEWLTALDWGTILILGLPFTILIMAGGRLLIVGRMQSTLVLISSVTLAGNAVLDVVLFAFIGPVGVVIASVILRAVIAAIYIGVIASRFNRIAAIDTDGTAEQ